MKATSLEQGVPVLLVSAMVQYINCARNKEVRCECGRARERACARRPSSRPARHAQSKAVRSSL